MNQGKEKDKTTLASTEEGSQSEQMTEETTRDQDPRQGEQQTSLS